MILNKYLPILFISVTGAFANTIMVQFTNLPYTTGEGDYTGWVIATVNDTPGELLMCDDFMATTYVPSGPLVFNFSTLGGDIQNGTVSNLAFGGQTNALELYEAAAYLNFEYWQLQPSAPVNPTATESQNATDYNFAIWNIFDPGVTLNSGQQDLQTRALSFIRDPSNAAFLMDTVYPGTTYYTPDGALNSAGNQEFGQFQAPEPGAGWLLAVGLAAVVAVRKRKSIDPASGRRLR